MECIFITAIVTHKNILILPWNFPQVSIFSPSLLILLLLLPLAWHSIHAARIKHCVCDIPQIQLCFQEWNCPGSTLCLDCNSSRADCRIHYFHNPNT